MFRETREAMKTLGITPEVDQQLIFRLVCGILHLGNVKFEKHSTEADRSQVTAASAHHLEKFSILTHTDKNAVERSFLVRKISVGIEKYDIYLDVQQAESSRDALAMSLYSSLFTWICKRLNEKMRFEGEDASTISVLDIYG